MPNLTYLALGYKMPVSTYVTAPNNDQCGRFMSTVMMFNCFLHQNLWNRNKRWSKRKKLRQVT